mmetsp:Transcript_3920/g.8464  ORF Transcript_3920/g.8464 Transcript_3920/m.8464 type:complete len:223 (+) Transcript_3920:627-1295(+)
MNRADPQGLCVVCFIGSSLRLRVERLERVCMVVPTPPKCWGKRLVVERGECDVRCHCKSAPYLPPPDVHVGQLHPQRPSHAKTPTRSVCRRRLESLECHLGSDTISSFQLETEGGEVGVFVVLHVGQFVVLLAVHFDDAHGGGGCGVSLYRPRVLQKIKRFTTQRTVVGVGGHVATLEPEMPNTQLSERRDATIRGATLQSTPRIVHKTRTWFSKRLSAAAT